MTKRNAVVCIAGILFLAALLRFYGISSRGLFYADETRYYRDTISLKQSVAAYFAGEEARTVKNFIASLLSLSEAFAGKPGNTLLGMIGLYMFGLHQYSVLFISALLGVGTVFLVFLIGYRFYDIKAGLLSALLLSICAAHVLFSRSFLVHSNQAFFLVLGVYLYLMKRRLLSALCLGYGFLVHPTGIIYVVPFLFCEVFFWIKGKTKFLSIFVFAAIFLIPSFLVEAISIFGRKEFGSLAVAVQNSYIVQMFFVNSLSAEFGIETNKNLSLFHYPIMSVLTSGVIFTVLLVLSMFFCLGYFIKNKRLSNFFIGVVPVILFFYWQFITGHERLFRQILVLFPFFCIGMAVFITKLPKKLAKALIALLLIEGLYYSGNVVRQVRSEFPALEKFLNAESPKAILTASSYIPTTADVIMPGLVNPVFFCVSDFGEAKKRTLAPESTYLIVAPSDWLGNETFRFMAEPKMTIIDPFLFYFPTFYETARVGDYMDRLAHKDNIFARKIAVFVMSDLLKEKKTSLASD